MKTKLNITLSSILVAALMSCSAGHYASAQYDASDDGYYNQNDQYNNDNYNNDNYDNNSNDYDDDYGTSNVSMDVFVGTLSPYGRWMNSPSYGSVWICNDPGFIPYSTGGHWMYTAYGWTWVSDYNWGWAPFHYGRWAFDAGYGWMWVPGYEWGPAWVSWRTGGDYYGWAPLSPGFNISVGFGNYYMPAERWNFVPRRYIASPYFGKYMVNRNQNVTIIRNTTIINRTNVYHNARYVVGPDRREVERFTGNRINTVRISNDRRPQNTRIVNNNTINMYRPEIKKNDRLTPERVQQVRERVQERMRENHNVPQNGNRNNLPQNHQPVQRNDQQRNNQPDQRNFPQHNPPVQRNNPPQNNQPDRNRDRRPTFDNRNNNDQRQQNVERQRQQDMQRQQQMQRQQEIQRQQDAQRQRQQEQRQQEMQRQQNIERQRQANRDQEVLRQKQMEQQRQQQMQRQQEMQRQQQLERQQQANRQLQQQQQMERQRQMQRNDVFNRPNADQHQPRYYSQQQQPKNNNGRRRDR